MNQIDEDRSVRIAEKAYGLWEREGRPDGKSLDHWLQAEADVASDTTEGKGGGVKARAQAGRPRAAADGAAEGKIGRSRAAKKMPPEQQAARPDRSDGLASN